jgi:hypothetical protein
MIASDLEISFSSGTLLPQVFLLVTDFLEYNRRGLSKLAVWKEFVDLSGRFRSVTVCHVSNANSMARCSRPLPE